MYRVSLAVNHEYMALGFSIQGLVVPKNHHQRLTETKSIAVEAKYAVVMESKAAIVDLKILKIRP